MPTLRGGAIALLALAVAPSTAWARAETAAFVRLDLFGTTDPDHVLDKDVRDALSDKLPLVSVRRVQEVLAEHPELATCTTPDCVKQLGTLLEARFLVVGQINQVTKDVNGELRLFDAGTGGQLAAAPVRCELCAWAEVRDGVSAAAKELAGRAASEPPLPPKPQLPPIDKPPIDKPPETGPSRPGLGFGVAGALTLAAAVGLIATGAVMMAYDGKCAVTIPPEAGPDALCPRSYDSMLEGGLFLGGGGVMLAASAGFFVAGARAARVVPAVSGSRNGAMFSLRISY